MTRFRFDPLERRLLLNAGQIDLDFGADGVQHINTTGVPETAIYAGVTSAADILVVGNEVLQNPQLQSVPILYRYLPDGRDPDSSFGDGGRVIAPSSFREAVAAAQQPDDGIIVALGDGSIARFNADGALDTAFGGESKGNATGTPAGRAKIAGADFGIVGMVVDRFDGRIALFGNTSQSYRVAMFTADGAPDTAFSDDGLLTVAASGGGDDELGATSAAFESDGSLVVGMSQLLFSVDSLDPPDVGRVDRIDRNGVRTTLDEPTAIPILLAVTADDQVVVLTRFEANDFVYGLYRLAGDGTPIPGSEHAVNEVAPTNLALLPEGRVVIGGLKPGDDTHYVVARYTTHDDLDVTFGSLGVATIDAVPVDPIAVPMIELVPTYNEKLVLVTAGERRPPDIALLRLQGDGTTRVTASGSLIIGGTGGDDVIRLYRRRRDGFLVADILGTRHAVDPRRVKKIAVFSQSGNDSITIGARVPGAYIDGGDGNDTIAGGIYNDTIIGDDGNDSIFGGTGRDKIFGGDGADAIAAGGGNDYVLGGAQNDSIEGNGGFDTLSGAGGQDLLHGGGPEIDHLLGGAGTDTATRDPNDVINSVENLLEPVF